MKLFGFELTKTTQTLEVVCPKCGHYATILFSGKEENVPIPFDKEIREGLKEAGLTDYFSLPHSHDLHFLCMDCMISSKLCEKFHLKCEIIEKAM